MTETKKAERESIIVSLDEAVKAGVGKVRTNYLLEELYPVNQELLFDSLVTTHKEE